MTIPLDLATIQDAIKGSTAAFRVITDLFPVGGDGDKVFPPTYEGSVYADETRIINGQAEKCVLLDSVQSQANRLELCLLEGHRSGELKFPPRRSGLYRDERVSGRKGDGSGGTASDLRRALPRV